MPLGGKQEGLLIQNNKNNIKIIKYKVAMAAKLSAGYCLELAIQN